MTVTGLQRDLLRWYDAHHRRLPWRASPGERLAHPPATFAYRVLVSETMLQQTQVATVTAYFERFMSAFPRVSDLAAADEQRVLRLWQGLGYYRRARNLHAAAKMIVERFAGQVPATVTELLQLPGVGRYTAGAVASIAYGQASPIVDGNVARVLSRWFEIQTPIDSTPGRKRLWELAAQVVDAARPGDFNQAVMELGALVCTPRAPACATCPVAAHCGAHQTGRADELPIVLPRKARRSVSHLIVAIQKPDRRCLFEQRPEQGLWSNMWQLVTADEPVGDVPAWVRARYGIEVAEPRAAGRFVHVTTHRDITFQVMHCDVAGGRLKRGAGVWRRLNQVDDLPLAKPQQRAIRMIHHAGR